MRATMDDGRQLSGQMLAFDKVILILMSVVKVELIVI
jgi:hypothetical protein